MQGRTWARLSIAWLGLGQRRALHSTIRRRRHHGATLRLHAAAASGRALAERRPVRHDAVDGAQLRITLLRLRQRRARLAAIRRRRHHCARLRLLAAAAFLGARQPGAPLGHHAVHGARVRAARARLAQRRRACRAAIGRLLRDRTRLRLRAAAARFIASRPLRPRADAAIHRAGQSVALLTVL